MSTIDKIQNKSIGFYQPILKFIKLSRVQFLLGGLLLYAFGSAAAYRMGITINWIAYLLGQLMVIFIQLMAQYLNEYYDIEVDSLAENNRTWFSGGSGILFAGDIPPSAVLTAARVCAVVAILMGITASFISLWIIPIFLLCFFGSWFYSAPPLSLMSSGWGELSTSLIVALLVPLTGYCMQGGFPPLELWLMCVPLVLVHAAMLISFEIPDQTADQMVSKKTLTVRLGSHNANWIGIILICLAYLFLVILLLFSKYPVDWMAWTFPLAIGQLLIIHRSNSSSTRIQYHLLTFIGISLFSSIALLGLLEFIFH